MIEIIVDPFSATIPLLSPGLDEWTNSAVEIAASNRDAAHILDREMIQDFDLREFGLQASVDEADSVVFVVGDLFEPFATSEPIGAIWYPPPPTYDADEIIITATRMEQHWELSTVTIDWQGVSSEPSIVEHLGPGEVPDVIQWTDPQQPTQNEAANPAVSISVTGNTVRIAGKISFQGPGAGTHTDAQLLAALNSTWSGTFGSYTVITNMTVGPGGIIVNVSGSSIGQPFTDRLGGSVIQAFTLKDVEYPNFTLDSFAHEFGHVLGLMDLYDTKGTMGRAPGYESNIMGNSSAPPSSQNIEDLIDENS